MKQRQAPSMTHPIVRAMEQRVQRLTCHWTGQLRVIGHTFCSGGSTRQHQFGACVLRCVCAYPTACGRWQPAPWQRPNRRARCVLCACRTCHVSLRQRMLLAAMLGANTNPCIPIRCFPSISLSSFPLPLYITYPPSRPLVQRLCIRFHTTVHSSLPSRFTHLLPRTEPPFSALLHSTSRKTFGTCLAWSEKAPP